MYDFAYPVERRISRSFIFVAHQNDHSVFIGDDLLHDLIDCFHRDVGYDHPTHGVVFVFDRRDRFVFEEMLYVFLHIKAVELFFPFVVQFFHSAQIVRFGTFVLAFGKAKIMGAFRFAQ